MKGFGFQDAIRIENREFRIHTGCEPDKKRILCEVFEEGRFVYSLMDSYDVRPPQTDSIQEVYLKNVTSELHQTVMDEVSVLFYAFEKLKKIKDGQPHYRLGKLFLARNFFEEAVACFQNAIRLKPDYIRAYQQLAITYLKMEKPDDAVETCNTVLELHPDFPDILDLLAVVYTHMGLYEKAKDALQKAIQIKPDYLESQFNLGTVLFLSTLSDEDENIVIPVRIMRMINQIREQEAYQDEIWQNRFEELEETIKSRVKNDIVTMLLQFQIYFIMAKDTVGSSLDFFLIKFMFGGKEIDQEEMEHYEKRISSEASRHEGFADYWNEMGVVHLIQCRDYFLKAMNEFEQAVRINPKYTDAKQNHDLIKNNKKGFLILLRAILK